MTAMKTKAKVSKTTLRKPAEAQSVAKASTVAKATKVALPREAAKAASSKDAAKTAKPKANGASDAASASLTEGDRAPAFSLADESGAIVSSGSLSGKPYVIYFYPKDDTPGCTKEACDFRDNLRAFNTQKVRVLGVSPDGTSAHAKFKAKYGLTFSLLSDTEKTLINAYGIWVKKQNYGREYMGVQRSTFIIDKSGKIAKAWHGVRVPGHVAAVLAAL